MKFSLIMGTYGRRDQVENFLTCLKNQTYKNFELIVVDQNEDDMVKSICDRFRKELDIKYIHSNKKGISRARNLGLKYTTGDIVTFPDDDCEYPPDLLENVLSHFAKNPGIDGVTGMTKVKTLLTQPMMVFDDAEGYISRRNIWGRCIEFTIFNKKEVASAISGFDELFGPGSVFGAAEGYDYILRALKSGFNFFYTPELLVYHPNPTKGMSYKVKMERVYNYCKGMGALLKKHLFCLKNFAFIPKTIICFISPSVRLLICLVRLKPKEVTHYYNILRGTIYGFIKYHQPKTKNYSSTLSKKF